MAGKSRQATTRQIDALAVLKQLNPDDIQQRVDELEKELRALRVLLRAVRPDAMPSSGGTLTPRRAPGGGPTIKDRVVEYLNNHGPSELADIADGVGAVRQSVSGCLSGNRTLFVRTSQGWRLKK